MGLFHWIGARVSADRQVAHLQAGGRLRDDTPADQFVQCLFTQIGQGGLTERAAWTKLAEYLAQEGSAHREDLMRP